MFLSHFKKNN